MSTRGHGAELESVKLDEANQTMVQHLRNQATAMVELMVCGEN